VTQPLRKAVPGLGALVLNLLMAGSAAAALKDVEAAYELGPAQLSLPAAENGNVAVRRCAGCAPDLLRVDAGTAYSLRPGAGNIGLEALRREAARVAGRPRTSFFVYYDPRTRVVRRIVLDATQ
jgi:hypothetical protein